MLGIRHDHPRRGGLQIGDGLDHAWRQHAIAIVGDDQRVRPAEQGCQAVDQSALGLFVERTRAPFVVAHQHVAGGDDPALGQGAPERMGEQVICRHRTLFQGAPQQRGVRIAAGDRKQGHLGAQRLHIDRGVGCASRRQFLLGDGHDRHRRLAAQAVGRAFQVHVEHGVANHNHFHAGERINCVNQAAIHPICSCRPNTRLDFR